MGKAFCLRCGTKAEADTPEQAISLLDHAVGKSRGIKCGGNRAQVETEGFSKSKPEKKVEPPKIVKKSA